MRIDESKLTPEQQIEYQKIQIEHVRREIAIKSFYLMQLMNFWLRCNMLEPDRVIAEAFPDSIMGEREELPR